MSLTRSLWSMISRHPQTSPSLGDHANSAPLKDNKTGNKMLQPKVFLDVANLIEGEGTSLEASLKVLHHHLPLIDPPGTSISGYIVSPCPSALLIAHAIEVACDRDK